MPEESQQPDGFPMAVIVEGGIALVAVLLTWLFGVPLRELLPTSSNAFLHAVARGLLATLPMLAIFFWLVRSRWKPFAELRTQVEQILAGMFPNATIGQLALVAALAGVGEELLFRGVVQTIFGWWTSPLLGLALASLLFGVMHALSKTYFVLATTIGLGLGWLTWHYHDLVAPIVAHSTYDFIALLYMTRQQPQR